MSDISFHFTWLDLLIAAPIIGWPGLLLGAMLGGTLWRKRRIWGAAIGAVAGCVIWLAASFLPKLL